MGDGLGRIEPHAAGAVSVEMVLSLFGESTWSYVIACVAGGLGAKAALTRRLLSALPARPN